MWKFWMTGAFVLALAACSDDEPSTTEKLKGSIWGGEFRYSTSELDQPFSILFGNDTTFQWYDISGVDKKGTWAVSGRTLTLTFTGGETMSATVSNNTWSEFNASEDMGFSASAAFKTSIPNTKALENTLWVGQTDNPNSKSIQIQFGTDNNVIFDGQYSQTYITWGAGIVVQFGTGMHGDTYYFVFNENKMIGIWQLGGSEFRCDTKKQE